MARQKPVQYRKDFLEKLARKLRDAPDPGVYSAAASLDFLGKDLRSLRDRGYSVEDIVTLLDKEGFETTAKALYAFFRKDNQPQQTGKPTDTQDKAPAESQSASNPTSAAASPPASPATEPAPASPTVAERPPVAPASGAEAAAPFSMASLSDLAPAPSAGGFFPFKS